jgi:hypothetical protein
LSCVCATCAKYWEARDRGIPEPRCTAKDGCGSPLKGDDFHEYDGPITAFERWCFVCGAESKYGVQPKDKSRIIGVCAEHVKWMDSLKPVDLASPISFELKGALLPKLKTLKTLSQAIMEVEGYYAKKNGG